jgi:type VI secretion system protein VasD
MKGVSSIVRLWTAISVLLLASCSSNGIMGDGVIDLTLKITVAGDVNPDENGRASPVFVQIIELRDTNSFKDADYLSLYQDARSELGAAFIHSTEIGPMFPNSTRTEKLRLNTVATAVGFLGEFNRYSEIQTSQSIELKPGKDITINVLIDGSGVHVN